MDTLNYIFGRLHTTEEVIVRIGKSLKIQNKINKRFATLALLTSVNVALIAAHIREQDKKIDRLSKEIEELKEKKGE